MKRMFNLTTSSHDLDRYKNRQEIIAMMEGFDGVELMYYGEDERQIIPPDAVIGYHIKSFTAPYWLDFYKDNKKELKAEFGSMELCYEYYGSDSPKILAQEMRDELERAISFGAEYVVVHVSDCSIEESFTGRYKHSNSEVISAVCEIINEVFVGENLPMLLLENLWVPGLTLTDVTTTQMLLDGVTYSNTGIMLDTGHFIHTDTSIRTQQEGITYIHKMLDAHGDLISRIKGVHLNQSLTGEYFEKIKQNPPALKVNYNERVTQLFEHIFKLDLHKPFNDPSIKELIKRISPDYLTFEFITENNNQLKMYLDQQKASLI